MKLNVEIEHRIICGVCKAPLAGKIIHSIDLATSKTLEITPCKCTPAQVKVFTMDEVIKMLPEKNPDVAITSKGLEKSAYQVGFNDCLDLITKRIEEAK